MLLLSRPIMDSSGVIDLISALRDIEKSVRCQVDRLPGWPFLEVDRLHFLGEDLPAFKLLKDCESHSGKAIKEAMSLARNNRMHSIPELCRVRHPGERLVASVEVRRSGRLRVAPGHISVERLAAFPREG